MCGCQSENCFRTFTFSTSITQVPPLLEWDEANTSMIVAKSACIHSVAKKISYFEVYVFRTRVLSRFIIIDNSSSILLLLMNL